MCHICSTPMHAHCLKKHLDEHDSSLVDVVYNKVAHHTPDDRWKTHRSEHSKVPGSVVPSAIVTRQLHEATGGVNQTMKQVYSRI